MLLDEARVAALVKHPNVVDIYDLGQADGRYFIAMEYLEGEPLLAVLRAGREGKRLDPLSTARLIADTAEGLDAAHELRSMAGEPTRARAPRRLARQHRRALQRAGEARRFRRREGDAVAAAPQRKVQGKFSYMAPEKLKGARRRSAQRHLVARLRAVGGADAAAAVPGGNDTETMKQVLEIDDPAAVEGQRRRAARATTRS